MACSSGWPIRRRLAQLASHLVALVVLVVIGGATQVWAGWLPRLALCCGTFRRTADESSGLPGVVSPARRFRDRCGAARPVGSRMVVA